MLHGLSSVALVQAQAQRMSVFITAAIPASSSDYDLAAQKRKLLAAAASAGVSVAFGSPLGGVLFGLEELDTFAFSNESDVMWRGFVTSVIAAVTLQYVDPFGTSKLVLFQVSGVSDTWRGFELVSAVGHPSGMIMRLIELTFYRCT